MKRLLQVLSLSTFGIILCLNPFHAIASGDKAIATEKGNESSFQSDSANMLEAQQFSNDTKIDAEVLYSSSDWKVRALKELTGRYECTMGLNKPFPSQSSYGQFELASWLNTCLEQIGDRFDTNKDREIAQKLKTEFKFELATIKAQNERLVKRGEELAKRENPPTTKIISHPVLPDVTPNQWNAVQSLLTKYRCISGLPNSFFQPDRPTTRYELAAALNACLRRNNNRFATQQDRELAQNLQQEFKTELAEIRNRTNELEARAATLEFQNFSPTSKLQGQTVITIQGGGF